MSSSASPQTLPMHRLSLCPENAAPPSSVAARPRHWETCLSPRTPSYTPSTPPARGVVFTAPRSLSLPLSLPQWHFGEGFPEASLAYPVVSTYLPLGGLHLYPCPGASCSRPGPGRREAHVVGRAQGWRSVSLWPCWASLWHLRPASRRGSGSLVPPTAVPPSPRCVSAAHTAPGPPSFSSRSSE